VRPRPILRLVRTDRSYSPETVAVMAAAFDSACRSLSARINGDEARRQALAKIILQHVDLGERDPGRLCAAAVRELAGGELTATG
jgi:hypothetical protein